MVELCKNANTKATDKSDKTIYKKDPRSWLIINVSVILHAAIYWRKCYLGDNAAVRAI